jgi:hypothetical protein
MFTLSDAKPARTCPDCGQLACPEEHDDEVCGRAMRLAAEAELKAAAEPKPFTMDDWNRFGAFVKKRLSEPEPPQPPIMMSQSQMEDLGLKRRNQCECRMCSDERARLQGIEPLPWPFVAKNRKFFRAQAAIHRRGTRK